MKLNITIAPYIFGDYINISPLKGDDPFNLDVDTAECKEIIAEEIIDYIPIDKLLEVITHYASKLRLGGKIILGGTDIIELSKDVLRQNKTMVEVNHEIYGEQTENMGEWGLKRGCLALNDVVTVLSHLNLKITKQRLDGSKFIVEAVRENIM